MRPCAAANGSGRHSPCFSPPSPTHGLRRPPQSLSLESAGFDDDHRDCFATLAQWIKANRLESATFHILTPYPGTPLFQQTLPSEHFGLALHRQVLPAPVDPRVAEAVEDARTAAFCPNRE